MMLAVLLAWRQHAEHSHKQWHHNILMCNIHALLTALFDSSVYDSKSTCAAQQVA
jgi:hypothetical protein